mmetsp:Transcript_30145/g.72363  ORF Transcript_30145/g.72363 Transcript_30145/m.72363 type:complete len:568 (-) Transcript_30145:1-1704(-)
MSNTNETLKNCGACKEDMARSAFSKKQWERKKFRRCKVCVENDNAFQRPSKKDHQRAEKKENLMVPTPQPVKELMEEKPQVAPERPPLDLADNKVNADKSLISNLEPMPAEIPIADRNETTVNVMTETNVTTPQIQTGKATKQGTKNELDPVVLSESTKSNSISSSMDVPSEPSSVATPSAAVSGDENTVQNSVPVVAKADKDTEDASPPTPEDQQPPKDPMDSSDVIKNNGPLASPSQPLAADAPTTTLLETRTPSRVEEMVQEHDAIFRAVFEPTNDQEEQYDDPQLLHRVSTEDVMEYEVEPIVNVEQEIYDLLNNPSAAQGILFVDSSELNMMDAASEDSPSASSSSSSKRQWQSTAEASVPIVTTTMNNNEGQASDANVENTTTDHSSAAAAASPPPPADIGPTIETIESDALDWDPSAMARLSPTASPTMPSSPPPIPPIAAAAEDEEQEDDDGGSSLGRMLWQHSSAIGYTCGACILGVIISALLAPQDHVILLVFAGLSLFLAILMLVAQFYGGDEAVSQLLYAGGNDSDDGLGAVDSLREPLLSGAAVEDRQLISDEV